MRFTQGSIGMGRGMGLADSCMIRKGKGFIRGSGNTASKMARGGSWRAVGNSKGSFLMETLLTYPSYQLQTK